MIQVRLARGQLELSPNYQELLFGLPLSHQDTEQLKLVRSFPSSLPQTCPSEAVLVQTPSIHVWTRFFRLLDRTALKLEQEAYTCQINPIPGHLPLLSAISPRMVGKPSWMGWNWSRRQVWTRLFGPNRHVNVIRFTGEHFRYIFQSKPHIPMTSMGIWTLTQHTQVLTGPKSHFSHPSGPGESERRPLGTSHPSAWRPILLCLPQPPLDGGAIEQSTLFWKRICWCQTEQGL